MCVEYFISSESPDSVGVGVGGSTSSHCSLERVVIAGRSRRYTWNSDVCDMIAAQLKF